MRNKKRSKQPSQVPPLDDRHYLAIDLLFYRGSLGYGMTRDDIAKECGVSRMQLWRWEQREDFSKAYDKEARKYMRGIDPMIKRKMK
jgi:transcriptional regulator with XRE-family HTH domain